MDALIEWGLDGEKVSVITLLLTIIGGGVWMLVTEKMVTGVRWKQKIEDCNKLEKAVADLTLELKQVREQDVGYRIELATLKEREQQWLRELTSPSRPKRGGQ